MMPMLTVRWPLGRRASELLGAWRGAVRRFFCGPDQKAVVEGRECTLQVLRSIEPALPEAWQSIRGHVQTDDFRPVRLLVRGLPHGAEAAGQFASGIDGRSRLSFFRLGPAPYGRDLIRETRRGSKR